MLLSMTGFGDAQVDDGDLTVSVEMRSVNNRFLKVQSRLPDGLASLESVIDKLVRKSLARGAVTVSIRLQRQKRESGYQLNTTLLHACWEQLQTAAADLGTLPPADLSSLLVLPDIVQEDNARQANDERAAELIRQAVQQALARLQVFRADEGRAITADLGELADSLSARLEQIIARAPVVVTDYAARLLERVREALAAAGATVDGTDLIREISIFADRADINEEITRLKSHLVQFRSFLAQSASEGRKLEFLGQEVYREINTIGAKANDVEIAHHVVEMKATVEKVREILQNVEQSAVSVDGDESAETPHLLVLSGPSGTGKTTLVNQLLEHSPIPLRKTVSATTRAPRAGEQHGEDYWFLDAREFARRRQAGEFLECAEVHGSGNWYGTLRSEIEDAGREGCWALLEIDVQGAMSVIHEFPAALTIFLKTPSAAEYERRLRSRGTESEEVIRRRLQTAERELQWADQYRFQVVNDSLDRAVAEISEILRVTAGLPTTAQEQSGCWMNSKKKKSSTRSAGGSSSPR